MNVVAVNSKHPKCELGDCSLCLPCGEVLKEGSTFVLVMDDELVRTADQSALEPSRYEALLQLADLISSPLELTSLFHQLSVRLKSVVSFDFLNLLIHDPQRNVMRLQIWEGMPVPGAPQSVSVEASASGWVLSCCLFPGSRSTSAA